MKFLGQIFFLIIITASHINAQNWPTKQMECDAGKFDIDNLGFCYFVNGTSITKMDSDFTTIYEYSDKTYGEITVLDVSDPFRILIYYKDFNTILFLDNKLVPLHDPIILDDIGFYSVDAVCSSSLGSFRIYDNQTSSVITIGSDLKIVQNGTNLYSISGDQRAVELKETANYVFVRLDSGYILRLDKFGNFANAFFSSEGTAFDCINDDIYIISDNELTGYSPSNEKIFYFSFDKTKAKDFKIKGKRLFILSEKSLITFQIL